ncbi:sigma-70 family RNA polymerase sigma factor [Devosia sp.]|uniref:RNA polymerase sigma factor n=1 Tax=Devosia sp. TaxID=1871048 RepID=UPI0032662BC8
MTSGRVAAGLPAELIALAQNGDHAAIATLLGHAQPDIRRYAKLNCRFDDIDDAVQDALLLVVRRISGLRSAAAFAGWLFAIVKRECYRLGRQSRMFGQPVAHVPEPALAQRPALELQYDLGMAIQSLPPHYRSVVLKRDMQEMSLDELAASEGITREAVKARLRRARAMIRDYLID